MILQEITSIIPYSRKYQWELSLAVGSQIAIANVLADLNLAVWYVIAIHIHVYVSNKFWWILIWQLLEQTTKPPNLIPRQIFWLYGILAKFFITTEKYAVGSSLLDSQYIGPVATLRVLERLPQN